MSTFWYHGICFPVASMPTFSCQFCFFFFFSQHFHANSAFLFFFLPIHLFFRYRVTKNVNWANLDLHLFFFSLIHQNCELSQDLDFSFLFFLKRAFRDANSSFFFLRFTKDPPELCFEFGGKEGTFVPLFFLVSDEKIAGLGGAKIRITPCFSEGWRSTIRAQWLISLCLVLCAHWFSAPGEKKKNKHCLNRRGPWRPLPARPSKRRLL